jgi:hypothetical protein
MKKFIRWNEINPASEKPKFGRGTAENEMKFKAGTHVQINDCRPQGNRTWLMIVHKREGNFPLFLIHYV